MSYDLAGFIKDLINDDIPLNSELLEYLNPTNRAKLNKWIARLEWVRNIDYKVLASARAAYNKAGKARKIKFFSQASVKSVKSALTGKILERIIKILFDNSQAVDGLTNIRSSTAEIDFLLNKKPMALAVPMLREAGTHLIGEAKCYTVGFKQEWVNELCGLMAQHQCTHSILFVGSPSKTLNIEHRHGLHIHSISGKNVVPFGMKQLKEVAGGENFLAVLGRQYVNVKASSTQLAI